MKTRKQEVRELGLNERFLQPHKEWEKSLRDLRRYKRKYGDCNVNEKKKPDLRKWLDTQLEAHQKLQLVKDREFALKALGVKFDNELCEKTMDEKGREVRWNRSFMDLQDFKSHYGHANVSRYADGRKYLGIWVKCQRTLARDRKLRRDRLQKLLSIGFETYVGHKPQKRTTDGHDSKPDAVLSPLGKVEDETTEDVDEDETEDDVSVEIPPSNKKRKRSADPHQTRSRNSKESKYDSSEADEPEAKETTGTRKLRFVPSCNVAHPLPLRRKKRRVIEDDSEYADTSAASKEPSTPKSFIFDLEAEDVSLADIARMVEQKRSSRVNAVQPTTGPSNYGQKNRTGSDEEQEEPKEDISLANIARMVDSERAANVRALQPKPGRGSKTNELNQIEAHLKHERIQSTSKSPGVDDVDKSASRTRDDGMPRAEANKSGDENRTCTSKEGPKVKRSKSSRHKASSQSTRVDAKRSGNDDSSTERKSDSVVTESQPNSIREANSDDVDSSDDDGPIKTRRQKRVQPSRRSKVASSSFSMIYEHEESVAFERYLEEDAKVQVNWGPKWSVSEPMKSKRPVPKDRETKPPKEELRDPKKQVKSMTNKAVDEVAGNHNVPRSPPKSQPIPRPVGPFEAGSRKTVLVKDHRTMFRRITAPPQVEASKAADGKEQQESTENKYQICTYGPVCEREQQEKASIGGASDVANSLSQHAETLSTIDSGMTCDHKASQNATVVTNTETLALQVVDNALNHQPEQAGSNHVEQDEAIDPRSLLLGWLKTLDKPKLRMKPKPRPMIPAHT